MKKSFVASLVASFALAAVSTGAVAAADANAAKALTKANQNNCMKCHGIDKDKDGPSFKKTAGKYKGKADAEEKLLKHLTSGPKVKLEDGTEENHKIIKTTPENDTAQIKNLIQFILEQQ